MRISGRRMLSLAALGAAITSAACQSFCPSTPLEIEVYGGFAYVKSAQNHELDIAFLKSTNTASCNVTQLGVDLMVVSGNIIEPANPPASRMFDLGGAVVTVGDTSPSNQLAAVRGGRPDPPYHPANPNNDADWEDLKWVPGTRSDYPNSTLNPNWPSIVDGYIKLTNGRIVGAHPGDVVVKDSVFEFRKANGTGSFTQAITDTTKYLARVRGNQVVLSLTGARSGINRIVVQSVDGAPIKLKLMGRHAAQTPATLALDDPIAHFCAFYELLTPVPPAAEQLIPHFKGVAAAQPSGSSGASPGLLCPGDYF
jgi:hypothetical protein